MIKLRVFKNKAIHRLMSTTITERPSRILITGGLGQLGLSITRALRRVHGENNVILTDVKKPSTLQICSEGPFLYLDVTNKNMLNEIIVNKNINVILHLSSVLSAVGELNPTLGLKINLCITHILEAAKLHSLKVIFPSTIGAFGPSTPKKDVEETCIQDPTTIYGITKLFGELLGVYYHSKYNVDFRCVRLPGIISCGTLPGGGTTDYAVDMFYKANNNEKYTCYLKKDTRLPMMYMPDCIDGIMKVMHIDQARLKRRIYNLSAFSFTPHELFLAIKKYKQDFSLEYKLDYRQNIADQWPHSLDSTKVRNDLGWKPVFFLDDMVKDMIHRIENNNFIY